jgi:hypothetical protein
MLWWLDISRSNILLNQLTNFYSPMIELLLRYLLLGWGVEAPPPRIWTWLHSNKSLHNPLKPEVHLNNMYKKCSYLRENTLYIYCEDQSFHSVALQAFSCDVRWLIQGGAQVIWHTMFIIFRIALVDFASLCMATTVSESLMRSAAIMEDLGSVAWPRTYSMAKCSTSGLSRPCTVQLHVLGVDIQYYSHLSAASLIHAVIWFMETRNLVD